VVTVRGLISEIKRHSGPEIWNFSVVLSCVPVNVVTLSSLTKQEDPIGVGDAEVLVPVVVPVVVLVPVVVPVVPVVPVVLVLVVCCPHAGYANTRRKVRPANIVRKYGTSLSPLVHIRFACVTLVHRHKSCNL
jgi:hypothetical protein